MAQVKFQTGKKGDVDAGLASGIIDSGDLLLTSDTDELIFINPDAEKKVIKSKTQKSYTLNGTNLGALEDGSTIAEGTSIDELLAMITQKAIPVEYTKPTLKVSKGTNGTLSAEAGTSMILDVNSSFVQNDAGSIISHEILKNGVTIKVDALNNLSYQDSLVIGDENISYTSKANYGDGTIKNNNLGQASPENAIKAGSIVSSNSVTVSGKRKLFYGTGIGELPELNSANIRVLNNSYLNPSNGYSFNIPIAIGQQYVIFAYPSSLKDVSQVMYVETNDTGMAPNFDKALVQVEGANGFASKEYKVYTYRMAVPAAASMTFKVTI